MLKDFDKRQLNIRQKGIYRILPLDALCLKGNTPKPLLFVLVPYCYPSFHFCSASWAEIPFVNLSWMCGIVARRAKVHTTAFP
jgi:hypothetical protein